MRKLKRKRSKKVPVRVLLIICEWRSLCSLIRSYILNKINKIQTTLSEDRRERERERERDLELNMGQTMIGFHCTNILGEL